MSNQQQPKLDTPIGLKYIKEMAEKYIAAKVQEPPGDHWQNNLSSDYYLGMLTGINLAMTGLNMVINTPPLPETGGEEKAEPVYLPPTPESLFSELNNVGAQLCIKIVERTSKIITLDK